ncbi:hypothetical protein HD806DRAFT_400081 [Xylariaceae sp. AK1471]|nr:hypothetical protein HD806DRAFT_400081 [Xylariaceae sp. AK1471]
MSGVKLCQVYPSSQSDTLTDVDVIAIHGLDTSSPETWTWKERDKNKEVNWLKDSEMLPHRIPEARIFTCDWPASLFADNTAIQPTPEELARSLLLGIKSRLGADSTRPIIFIASCLGGIILIQAMAIAASGDEYYKLWTATRGIVFLATPFRGTAFEQVANIATKILNLKGRFASKVVTNLLNILKEPNQYLQDLVADFTRICQHRELNKKPCHLAIFYEAEKGNLLRKVPFLGIGADLFNEPRPLVDSHSARLDMVQNPIPLQRTHVMMNKFDGPEDLGYDAVAGRIEIMLCEIRKLHPIEKANAWIHNEHYCLEKLGIERLSGALLPMDRCYINLSIVEKPRDKSGTLNNEDRHMPQEDPEIELSTLFSPRNPREAQNADKAQNDPVIPRRILIRGRAGVGKTTLCKRIVYEFTYKKIWCDLFKDVLWVPLRNLKLGGRRSAGKYSFKWLFQHEYFSQSLEPKELADALCDDLTVSKYKYVFILDGLDEVSQDLDDDMSKLLDTLLNQPNVIITSRPGASLPRTLDHLDLELETIGFYPNQVEAYIGSAFPDPQTGEPDTSKVEGVKSFLHRYPLIQDLVRIPIQLDAFCYTWNFDSDEKDVQETMAAVYQNIELRLWMKDAVHLRELTKHQIEEFNESEVRGLMENELHRIEILAFTGIYNNIIDFDPKHRAVITKHFLEEFSKPFSNLKTMIPLNSLLSRVSFLRSSDRSSTITVASYHFLHLTFQEYFGARYFVRQWEAQKQLKCLTLNGGKSEKKHPEKFLGEKKYNARYDMFWRFVAGLLDEEQEVVRFFQTIEEEPRDLLGPTHQRLVARCLSEVSTEMPLLKCLEKQLSQWVEFDCKRNYYPVLAGEIVLSAAMLMEAMHQEPRLKAQVLNALSKVRVLSKMILSEIASQLQDESRRVRYAALRALSGQQLTEEHIQKIVSCLKVERCSMARSAAIKALKGQLLTDEHLETIEACIKDGMELGIIIALQGWQLTDQLIRAVIACLNGGALERRDILPLLKGQPLTEEHFRDIEERLIDEDNWLRAKAIKLLEGKPLTKERAWDLAQGSKYPKTFMLIKAYMDSRTPKGRKATDTDLQKIEEILQSRDGWGRAEDLSFIKDKQLTRNPKYMEQWPITLAIESSRCRPSVTIPYLEDESSEVKTEALRVLESQPRSALSGELLDAIVKCCEDDDESVRWEAVQMFQGWPTLEEKPFQAVKARLKDESSYVQREAIKVFQSWPTLSADLLQSIAELFKDEDWKVRAAALNAIEGKPKLPEELLQSIAAYIKVEYPLVQRAAIDVLKSLPYLSEKIRQTIAECLGEVHPNNQIAAIELLNAQKGLAEKSKQAIAAWFKVDNQSVQKAAVKALISQQALSSIPNEDVELFYQILLQESFSEHVSWRVNDGDSYITLGHEEYSQPLPDRFIDMIRQAQKKEGVPSHPSMRAQSFLESFTRFENPKRVEVDLDIESDPEVVSSVKSVKHTARRFPSAGRARG